MNIDGFIQFFHGIFYHKEHKDCFKIFLNPNISVRLSDHHQWHWNCNNKLLVNNILLKLYKIKIKIRKSNKLLSQKQLSSQKSKREWFRQNQLLSFPSTNWQIQKDSTRAILRINTFSKTKRQLPWKPNMNIRVKTIKMNHNWHYGLQGFLIMNY